MELFSTLSIDKVVEAKAKAKLLLVAVFGLIPPPPPNEKTGQEYSTLHCTLVFFMIAFKHIYILLSISRKTTLSLPNPSWLNYQLIKARREDDRGTLLFFTS